MSDIDIFAIPLYYISFKPKPKLESNLSQKGFKNINFFPAVDGRKFDIGELKELNMISIRAYTDLTIGREEHSGLPSLGSVGCTMSHYKLWKKCVDHKLPYIIIAEDDVNVNSISEKDLQNIRNIILKKNGVFVSSNISRTPNTFFFGTHFCIVSLGACKELIEYAFPIDVQTDYYMAHLDTLGKISIEGFKIASQSILQGSSIQNNCIKCILPKSIYPYIIFFVMLLTVILLFVYLWRRCRSNCRRQDIVSFFS